MFHVTHVVSHPSGTRSSQESTCYDGDRAIVAVFEAAGLAMSWVRTQDGHHAATYEHWKGPHIPGSTARRRSRRLDDPVTVIYNIVLVQPFHPSDVIRGHSDRYFVWARLGLIPSMVIKDNNVEHHPAIIPGGRSLSVLTFCLKSTNGSYHGSVRSSK